MGSHKKKINLASSKKKTLTPGIFHDKKKSTENLERQFIALGATILFLGNPIRISNATEFDILAEEEPKSVYYIDDASVLSRSSREEINSKLSGLNSRTGF